jgi:hypothetical protein
MLLAARILDNVAGVNSYIGDGQSFEFTEGDGPTIYLQLLDMPRSSRVERRLFNCRVFGTCLRQGSTL